MVENAVVVLIIRNGTRPFKRLKSWMQRWRRLVLSFFVNGSSVSSGWIGQKLMVAKRMQKYWISRRMRKRRRSGHPLRQHPLVLRHRGRLRPSARHLPSILLCLRYPTLSGRLFLRLFLLRTIVPRPLHIVECKWFIYLLLLNKFCSRGVVGNTDVLS